MGFWLIMLQQPGAHIATKLNINIEQVEQKGNPIKQFFLLCMGGGGVGGWGGTQIQNP